MSIPGAGSPLFLSAAAAEAVAAHQIDRSLRFNDDDTAHLSRTPSSASNRTTWTWSAWVKRSKVGAEANLFSVGASSTEAAFRFNTDDTLQVRDGGGGELTTNAVFRDPSAWFHIVVALDNTKSTDTDRFKLYVNGVEQTYSGSTYASQNTNSDFNTTNTHYIGRQVHNTANLFDGYLTEIHFVDGTQLAASDFGFYDSNNVWQPKDCKDNLTYGTNGFYLKFADNTSNSALGTDSSGNDNDWTVNNITANAGALQGQTWSNNITTTGNSGNWWPTYPVTYIFDATTTNYGHPNGDGSAVTVTFNLSPAVTCNTGVTFIGGLSTNSVGVTISINDGTAVNCTAGSSSTTETVVPFSGSVSKIVLTRTANSGGLLMYGFKIDGSRLVDSGVTWTGSEDTDSLIDTPTNYTPDSGNPGGNYATFSPIDSHSSNTFANGNLEATNAGVTVFANLTMGFTSGKWYCEIEANGGGATSCMVGVCDLNKPHANRKYGQTGGLYMYQATGGLYSGGFGGSFSNGTYGSAYSDGDIIGIGLDMDNGNVRFYINGSDQGQANTSSLAGALVSPAVNNDTNTASFKLNTGQRPFAYTPPTDHKAICTTNFADPTIADGSTAMDVVTYTGTVTDTSSQTVTGLNFQSDLVWIKRRDGANSHQLVDSVRGTGKWLESSSDGAEGSSNTNGVLTAFNSNGFTLTGGSTNANLCCESGFTYVGWAWDAGTSTATNTDGSITTNVRANASAGFSIIGYTGNATTGATLGHGLNSAPELLIFKVRSDSGSWYTYHESAGATKYFTLDRTHGATSNSFLNNTAPTNSVITLSNAFEVNGVGEDIICYAWTSVSQYSSFGSYVGNGSSSGPFVFTGFRPALVICKASSTTSSWNIFDSTRASHNVVKAGLLADSANAEFSSSDRIDILSNGFKVRSGSAEPNASGVTYVYMAWAEHPFATARAR